MTRFEVFSRDNFTCVYCGRRPPQAILELEHIDPISRGGDSRPCNLTTSCRECNRQKRANVLSPEQRMAVSSHIPAMLWEILVSATEEPVNPTALTRLLAITDPRKSIGVWAQELETLHDDVVAEDWQQMAGAARAASLPLVPEGA